MARRRKSLKQKKAKIPPIKQEPKPFCPRSMIRYDGIPGDYGTRWICKMCLCCCLSQNAAEQHLITCQPHVRPEPQIPTSRQDIVPGYNCEFCDRVFSRFVILKKHLEVHRKRRNSENSDNDD